MIARQRLRIFPEGEDWSWQDRAACKGMDPSMFFAERGENAYDAKEICFRCGVREECLDYALRNSELLGVWGGKSPKQRRALRRAVDVLPGMKRCSLCRQVQPVENYHQSKTGRDGLHTQCKNCRNRQRLALQRRRTAS